MKKKLLWRKKSRKRHRNMKQEITSQSRQLRITRIRYFRWSVRRLPPL